MPIINSKTKNLYPNHLGPLCSIQGHFPIKLYNMALAFRHY